MNHCSHCGELVNRAIPPGEETIEARLFEEDAIPWDELAFRVVAMTLKRYFRDAGRGEFPFHIDDVTTRMKRIP